MSGQSSLAGRYARVSQVALLDRRLPAEAKVILGVLGIYADARGQCYPSIPTIAAAVGVQARQVRKHLRLLEDLGYLSRRLGRVKRSNGRLGSNNFLLFFPPAAPRRKPDVSAQQDLPIDRPADLSSDDSSSDCDLSSEDTPDLSSEGTLDRSSEDSRTNPMNKPKGNERETRAREAPPTSEKPGKTKITDDWRPSAASEALAIDRLGIPRDELELKILHFIAWHQKHEISLADWDAAFREWITNPRYQRKGQENGDKLHVTGSADTTIDAGDIFAGRNGRGAGGDLDIASRIVLADRNRRLR